MRPGFLPHNFRTVGQSGVAPGSAPVAYIPVVPSILLAILAAGALLAIIAKGVYNKKVKASYTVTSPPPRINVNIKDLTTLITESIAPPRSRPTSRFQLPGEEMRAKPKLPKVIEELVHAINTPILLRKLGKRKSFIKLWTAAGFVKGTPESWARRMGIPWDGDNWYKKVAEIRSGELTRAKVAKIIKERREMMEAAKVQ